MPSAEQAQTNIPAVPDFATPVDPATPTLPVPGYETADPNDSPYAFGPNPQTPTENAMSVSGGQAQTQFTNESADLDAMLNAFNQANPAVQQGQDEYDINTYSDPYMDALNSLYATSDQASQALISSMMNQNQQMRNQLDTQYDNYTRGLQLLGIQTNRAQATPDLLMGHIQQAQNELASKIQQINVEERLALLDAQQAKDERNLSLLKEKMDYIRQLKKDKLDVLRETYERMQLQSGIAEEQARIYYNELMKLPENQREEFLIAVSQRFGIPLAALTTAVSQITEDKKAKLKKASGSGSYSKTQKEKLEQKFGADWENTTTRQQQLDFLYGDEDDEDELVASLDNIAIAYMGNYSRKQLYEVAKELGLRKVNLSKQDEIRRLRERIIEKLKPYQNIIKQALLTQSEEEVLADIINEGIL